MASQRVELCSQWQATVSTECGAAACSALVIPSKSVLVCTHLGRWCDIGNNPQQPGDQNRVVPWPVRARWSAVLFHRGFAGGVSTIEAKDAQQEKVKELLEDYEQLQLKYRELEVVCSNTQAKYDKLRERFRQKELKLDRCELQLEQQAHQLEAQEDRVSELMLIMMDTEKTLAKLTTKNNVGRIHEALAQSRPEDKGPCYWIFDNYQSGVAKALKTTVVDIAHEFAREGLITPAIEKSMADSTTPSDHRADELVKAVQAALDNSPHNFRKVIDVLRSPQYPKCKKVGDKLASEYQLAHK